MNHFKNFKGFGCNGNYCGHWEETPVEIARRVLSLHRGEEVILEYEEVSTKDVFDEEFRYDQSGMFTPHEDRIVIPKNGAIEELLAGVNTDSILIKLPDGQRFEVQKIVINNQFVTQLAHIDNN